MNSRTTTTNPLTKPVPPTRAQIAALAHEIWLERGSPEGSDIDIWLEAERQLHGAAPRHAHADGIPADPGDQDVDPALEPRADRELHRMGQTGDRGPTAFGVT